MGGASMQPVQRSPRLRVGWWIIIGGIAALILAMILLFTRVNPETLGGTPPPDRNLAILQGENSTVIRLYSGMTISSFVEETVNDPEVSIISPSGKSIATVQENVPSLFNKSTLVQYRLTSSWYIAEEGEYTLISNKSGGQVWFVDLAPIIEEQGNTRDSTMFSACCLSLCLMPIGIIVLLVSGGKSNGRNSGTTQMMMQTDDGRLIPVVMQEQPHQQVQMGVALPTTNDVYAAYHGHAKSDPIASDPDAHSAIRTTDVPDPFIGDNTASNDMNNVPDVQIVASSEPIKVQVNQQVDVKEVAAQNATEKDEEEKNGAWKAWDEG